MLDDWNGVDVILACRQLELAAVVSDDGSFIRAAFRHLWSVDSVIGCWLD